MKLQQFDGGLATRLAPQLLNLNEGVIYENIDNSTGVLTPLKDKVATDIVVKPYHTYYSSGNEWISSDVKTDFLEFQKVMYLTDRVNPPQKYSEGTYSNLGIEPPTSACILGSQKLSEPIIDITVTNSGPDSPDPITPGDLPRADLDYVLINQDGDIYSAPFRFTVSTPGRTTNTTFYFRVDGEIVNINDLSQYEGNSISTSRARDRTIGVSNVGDLGGQIKTAAKLYRLYNGKWHFLHDFLDSDPVGTLYEDITYDISTQPVLDLEKFSAFNGTYQYVYTYYNVNDGSESAPSPLSAELKQSSGEILVSGLVDSPDPQVTHKRIYRIGNNITQFTLVAEIPADNQAFLDNLKDTELDGRLLESDNYYAAPAGLSFLSEAYAMLFGAVGTSLRFTPIANPNAWPPEYEIQFDAEITGLGAVSNGLLVFTRFKTFIVTGTGPFTLVQQSLRGDQGCIAFESIKEAYEGTLIWASEDGLCTSSGNNVVSITKNWLGEILLDPVDSVVHDEIYYCQNSDGKILAWDYRFKPIPKWLDLGTIALSVSNNELYGYLDGVLYILYKDTNNLTFKYKSPRLVEGSYSEAKTYKKVYIRSEGDIILDIIIDDRIVANFTLTDNATTQLQVPQSLQRGYSMQFNVEGTGTIHELEFRASPRQNA